MRIDSRSKSPRLDRRTARPAARGRATPFGRLPRVLLVLLALPVALARPVVAVSIHPYASLVEQIVGSDATVVQVLPSGASPHTFDPTPSQVTAIAGSALVIMNGGVDEWMRKVAVSAAPKAPLFVVTERLSFTPIQGTEAGVAANPHVWLDPSLMVRLVPQLVGALTAVDPADAATFRANGAALVTSLQTLDGELSAELAPLEGVAFVPFHDAWPYFARHFGLDLVVSIEPAPGREPSPRYVADAIAKIRASGARAVFDEAQLSPRPAEVVAQAAGVRLATLDPVGRSDQTYQQLMRADVAIVKAALTP